jgi:signal transduction histidine kinase
MSRRSLTFRLVAWYCGLLFGLGAIFTIFTYVSFDRYVEQATRATLSGRAEALWSMGRSILTDRIALTGLVEQRFAPESQNRLIRVSSGDQVLYQSGMPENGAFDPKAVPMPSGDGIPHLTRQGDLYLYVSYFTLPDGRRVAVESGRSADMMEMAEHRLVRALLFGLPVLLIVAAIGGYVLVQRALKPVEEMIEAAEALTFNSPRKRLPLAGTEDRIDALGQTLNRMLERLDNAYQHVSRFSADAAHELRTPLAIMRGELELLAEEELQPDMGKAVTTILGETTRLTQIVESLIAMGQLDSVSGKRMHHPIDLFGLAAETVEHIRLLADEKGIAIEGPTGAHIAALGDRDRLKQVIVNLIDNAIKYTPVGGQIAITVEEAADHMAALSVTDSGVGIAPENLELVFDRFYRVTTDRGEIGAGLGLAIVKSICTAHGGKIVVESTLGKGSTFRMEIPRA